MSAYFSLILYSLSPSNPFVHSLLSSNIWCFHLEILSMQISHVFSRFLFVHAGCYLRNVYLLFFRFFQLHTYASIYLIELWKSSEAITFFVGDLWERSLLEIGIAISNRRGSVMDLRFWCTSMNFYVYSGHLAV